MSRLEGAEPLRMPTELVQDPHGVYRKLRGEGAAKPVIMPSGVPGWIVTSYRDARKLLTDPRLSKNVAEGVKLLPPEIGASYDGPTVVNMLNSDPPDHTRLRRLVTKVFTSRAVERLRPRIEQAADALLDTMPWEGAVDLIASYALPLPVIVICELLGVPASDRDDFREWTAAVVSNTPPERMRDVMRDLTGYLTRLIAAKTAEPAEDLLSDLIRVSDEHGSLSCDEVIGMAFLFLVAGFETTLHLIANSVLALLRHPGQLALLRSQPSLLPGAIEELLRFDSPVHIATMRFTTEPTDVAELEIPAGQHVMISLLAANRDGVRFAEPDMLDLTRDATGHLAFGHGIHHCVGAPLARLEGQIAIARLLSRYPVIALDCDPDALRWRDSTLTHGLYSLPLRVSVTASAGAYSPDETVS